MILNFDLVTGRFGKTWISALLAIAVSTPAHAGEGLFSRAYTTETVPAGHFELEQTVRDRTERAYGTYNAIDFKSEFEYGVTDNFQIAFYLNTLYMHAVKAPDDNDPNGDLPGGAGFTRTGYYLEGFSAEFLYRALSPISDPIGLAFYMEPEWELHDLHDGLATSDSLELEFRILVQKNFFDDQLILAYNLVLELEYFRYDGGETPFFGEADWNHELGASYRVAANWFAGFEARNHNEVGNYFSHDHSVIWVGPVVHYGGPLLWATLGVLREISGNPTGYDPAGSFLGNGLFLHSHELWETTFKIGFPF